MPPAVTKFHDVLAPRWHEAQGAGRMKDTCAAIGEFQSGADAIAKATPPTTADADNWTKATRALVDGVTALQNSCKGNDTAQFDIALGKVHDAYHALLDAAGPHKMQ
jgi:hypothetical protein